MLQNAPRSKLEMGGVVLESLQLKKTSTAFDLTLFVWEAEGRLVARAEYSTDLFDRSTVERLVEHLRVLLEGACRDPDALRGTAPAYAGRAREAARGVERSESEYPEGACVHQLLEAQVARTPEAVALEEGSLRVSYRELDERANRLAHELMARGVGPAVLVGVSLERSVDSVASVLAVLKAGGAYVPLDPSIRRSACRSCARTPEPSWSCALREVRWMAPPSFSYWASMPKPSQGDRRATHDGRSTPTDSSPSSTRPARPAFPRECSRRIGASSIDCTGCGGPILTALEKRLATRPP